jgi:hypothetical protein
MADMRSSVRRSIGRGTEVESDTVVDSNAASVGPPPVMPPGFLRISDPNMVYRLQRRMNRLKMGLYGHCG